MLDTFYALSAKRQKSMGGLQPISFIDINAYFDIYKISDMMEREQYIHYIGVLDSEYLQYHHERQEAERKHKEAMQKNK